MLSISVAVPIRNAVRTLPYCLEALARLDPMPREILLINNGSTDGSHELLRAFARAQGDRVRVVEEPRRGISRARNAGIRAATGQVIAWTDADCAPSSAWLHHLVQPFSDPTIGGVAGRVLAAPASTLVERFCGLYTFQTPGVPARQSCWTPRTGGYAGANFAVRRVLAEDLGGYDEQIVNWGEDYDFCARLYARGASITYTPDAQVFHYHRATLLGMMRQAFGQGRSHSYLLARHVTHGLLLELPRFSIHWQGCPVRAWIDLASADKKMAASLLLGAVYPPALFLVPAYAAWLAIHTGQRARRDWDRLSLAAAIGLAGLLVLKSAAMTAGRWWGSVKYGAVCL
jgi:O-antigen biosynthesis protein